MKKGERKTIREQYEEILSKPSMDGRWSEPIAFDSVKVLAFLFPNNGWVSCFHIRLMIERIPHLIFDGSDNRAQVVMYPDADAEEKLLNFARENRGESCNVILG